MRLAATVIALTLFVPSSAGAETGRANAPRVAILETSLSDSMRGPLRERVLGRLIEALRDGGLDVVEPEAVTRTLEPLGPALAESCRAGQCVSWVLDVLDADVGLRLSIRAVESSYTITVTVLGPEGDELTESEGRCDICTFEELGDAVAEVAEEVVPAIPRRIRAGHLGVAPSPEGAEIRVDGVSLGRGALTVPLPPGRHVVEARLGERGARREVEVAADRTTRLDLVLTVGSDRPEQRSTRGIEAFLSASVALGLAFAVTGSVLLGLDPVCLTETRDGGCGRTWNEQHELGAGFLASGLAVALSAGISLIFLAVHQGDSSRDRSRD